MVSVAGLTTLRTPYFFYTQFFFNLKFLSSMKKFIANAQVRNLAMSLFFLLGLMFVNLGSASAQATVGGSSTNWLPDGQAIAELKSKVVSLKSNELLSSNPSQYAVAEATYYFYVGMMNSINGGMSTEQAYNANLVNITSQASSNATGSSAVNPNTPVDAKAIQTIALTFLTY